MARKPTEPPAQAIDFTIEEKAPAADMRTREQKAAEAVADLPDYAYADFEHDGQAHVAWRSRNGVVHIENRGA